MSDSTMLRITNNDKKDLNINCDNCKNNGVIELLNFEPGLLPSGESIDIDVVFRPGKAVQYKETFEFEINGVCKKKVTVKGEGALMKVKVTHLTVLISVMYMYMYVIQYFNLGNFCMPKSYFYAKYFYNYVGQVTI